MADGIYYVDKRLPHLVADQGSITLSTTQKALWAVGATSPTILPANYWTPGKTVRLTANVKLVTDGTAGNYVFGMAYGAADAPPAVVVTTSQAGVVSKTFGAFFQGYATCRTTGTAGTLSMWGYVLADLSGVLSTAQPMIFPSGGVTVVSTVDTTVGTNAPFFEAQRSGAGVWTAVTTDLHMEAMN